MLCMSEKFNKIDDSMEKMGLCSKFIFNYIRFFVYQLVFCSIMDSKSPKARWIELYSYSRGVHWKFPENSVFAPFRVFFQLLTIILCKLSENLRFTVAKFASNPKIIRRILKAPYTTLFQSISNWLSTLSSSNTS